MLHIFQFNSCHLTTKTLVWPSVLWYAQISLWKNEWSSFYGNNLVTTKSTTDKNLLYGNIMCGRTPQLKTKSIPTLLTNLYGHLSGSSINTFVLCLDELNCCIYLLKHSTHKPFSNLPVHRTKRSENAVNIVTYSLRKLLQSKSFCHNA